MTQKSDFNAEEWSTVLEGPATAGLIVVAAQRGGTIREAMAMAKTYAHVAQEHETNDLIREIASARPEVDPKRYKSAEELREQGLQRVREAVSLIEQKGTPEEAEAYKRFTLTVADHAAHADKTGGFLGVGGREVSDSEEAALKELEETLGVTRG
jgi:hypothetical protein